MSAIEYKYTIVGRYLDGVNVLGYAIQNKNTNDIKLLDRVIVEQMALSKEIDNVSAQIYNGKVLLKGKNCKLSTLPNYDSDGSLHRKDEIQLEDNEELVVTARITQGKSTTGYIISLRRNGEYIDKKSITREGLMRVAKEGYISNVRVQLSNKKPVLRGMNCELAKLPIYRQSELSYQ